MVVSDGREEDRLYQVMTDSETLVGDMPMDGIFVLEVSDFRADIIKQDSYTQLISPMQEHNAPPPYVEHVPLMFCCRACSPYVLVACPPYVLL